MIYKVTKLRELGVSTDAVLTEYILDNFEEIDINRKRPAVVICPGGGYCMVSQREAEPIALKFLANGYSAFILTYSVVPAIYPTQLLEVSAAIAHVRQNSAAYHIDENKILVCGFSAGGHLAATVSTLYNTPAVFEHLNIKEGDNKPNGSILAYPVIAYCDKMHESSFVNLVGEQDKRLYELLSLEKQITKDTPPAFIWHTFNDTVVPVENSLMYASALAAHQVPFELHIFPDGSHGLSLCNELTKGTNPHCEVWMDLCLKWMEDTFSC